MHQIRWHRWEKLSNSWPCPLCLRSGLAAADVCASSPHLSSSLSFMHRGHKESMTNFFFSPPLALFTSINFEKVILINFSHTEGQSYYYKQRYGWKEWGQRLMSGKASILELCETRWMNGWFNPVAMGVSWCMLLKVGHLSLHLHTWIWGPFSSI